MVVAAMVPAVPAMPAGVLVLATVASRTHAVAVAPATAQAVVMAIVAAAPVPSTDTR